MAYTKLTEAERDALVFTAPDGRVVPLIAPDEEVVTLDTGETIAVSAQAHRDEFTQGRVITAFARWIDSNGDTRIDYAGRRVVTEFRHNASVGQINTYTEAAIRREVLLLLLGEPLTVVDGIYLVPWSAEVIECCSIRHAIAAATDEGPDFNVASLL